MCVFVVETFGFVDAPLVPVLNPTLKLLDFVDFAGGITLYQRVNSTDIVWIDGGVGVVEVYGFEVTPKKIGTHYHSFPSFLILLLIPLVRYI